MLSDTRWKIITESEFAWERNALEFLRKHLPDRAPYRAWTNFEFIADNGKVYEVDALILAPRGIFLVEIKSDLGALEGDAHTWTWTTPDGRRYSKDNPLLLANRKAKQLASLLRQQKSKPRIHITPIIYCSANGLNLKLSESGAHNVYISASGPRGIIEFLTGEPDLTMGPDTIGDHRNLIAIEKALDTAGIRRSNRARRVGQYELKELLAEGATWQDWLARNPDFEKVERRIRLYPYRLAASKAAQEKLRRAVKREFDLLAGIEHPGILKPHDPVESDQGPALTFDYDPTAMRLDHYLERNHSNLPVETRLHLMRRIAETIAYAHSRNVVHRALSPLSVLVIRPDQAKPEVKIFDWQAGFRRSAEDPEAFDVPPTSHVEEMVDSAASAYMAPESFSYPDQLSETADIFSLGAIAYHIFSGQRPAEHQLQLHSRLLDTRQGLQL
ncbi:MAG: NERD domain-containing protein, partial [Deltaproteobacteria bacterium]|nr:NERD domain-containing protein [Deltaproteobacteria bacterium]